MATGVQLIYRKLPVSTAGNWKQGRSEGDSGVPVTPPPPLCKPFFKQTTYNILWRKRHDDNV